jgi:hypothetical protein
MDNTGYQYQTQHYRNNQYQPKRQSNRKLLSILLKRYKQMCERRFGEDIEIKVDMNDLLLDCLHYDVNIVNDTKIPYVILDSLSDKKNHENKE